MCFRSDRKLQIGVSEFDSLWNPSSLGATEQWLGLTEFTSLGSNSCFGITEFANRLIRNAFCGKLKLNFWVMLLQKPLHFVMFIHSISSISIHRVCCQCLQHVWSELQPEQVWGTVQMSEGTSPSSSYDEGSRSTPSNLPKAATRTGRRGTQT